MCGDHWEWKKYVMEHNRFADASLCPIAVAMLDGKGTQVHKIFQFLFIPSLDVVTFDNVPFLPMPNCPWTVEAVMSEPRYSGVVISCQIR